MKRLKILSLLLVGFISSFFFVNKVDALLTNDSSKTNTFSIAELHDLVFQYYLIDENDNNIEFKEPLLDKKFHGTIISLDDYLENVDYNTVTYTVNGNNYTSTFYEIDNDSTIRATYLLNRYSIVYNLNDGVVSSNPTIYSEVTGDITLNNPTKEDCEFTGWTWDGQTEPVVNVTFPSSDKENKEFTANFRIVRANYSVTHKKMTVDGSDYVMVEEYTRKENVGNSVTPVVNEYTGFISPPSQTITVLEDGSASVVYLYDREQYTLTINNSENVTTETPSGDYYYGTTINLSAHPLDTNGAPFVKWSNGETDLDISFVMENDVTIAPIYGTPYIISFETNGGSPVPADLEVLEGDALGTLPTPSYNDCTGTEGSYSERGCTYFYTFEGWFSDANFEHQVNERYVPTDDMTLYAKWNKIYFHKDSQTFTGNTADMVDTGIALFSEENAGKDFIVTFTLDSMDSSQTQRAVLFANLDERAMPYAGTMFRRHNNNKQYEIVANVSNGNGMGHRKTDTIADTAFVVGQTFVLKRENDLLYYSLDGGNTFTLYNDFTNFSDYFDTTASFGGEYNSSMSPYRIFKGTLSNMTVELIEPKTYTVTFDANGGSGTMIDQDVPLNRQTKLRANTYTKIGYKFSHWNTAADDSGTSYTDEQQVLALAGEGETVTLYAQWEDAPRYYVRFDANGGSGTMADQEFVYGIAQNLTTSTYTMTDHDFFKWNTAADGSGTYYRDGEEVNNLSSTNGDIVTLYAIYAKEAYTNYGRTTFNGIDDYINTGINIFSEDNIDNDFDIEFTIVQVDPALDPVEGNQTTIMNVKDETHAPMTGGRVPGFVTRFDWENTDTIHFLSFWEGNTNRDYTLASTRVPVKVVYKRRDRIITVEYTYGTTTTVKEVIDQTKGELDTYSPLNIVFGASQNSSQEYIRFFKGALEDIEVRVYDD